MNDRSLPKRAPRSRAGTAVAAVGCVLALTACGLGARPVLGASDRGSGLPAPSDADQSSPSPDSITASGHPSPSTVASVEPINVSRTTSGSQPVVVPDSPLHTSSSVARPSPTPNTSRTPAPTSGRPTTPPSTSSKPGNPLGSLLSSILKPSRSP